MTTKKKPKKTKKTKLWLEVEYNPSTRTRKVWPPLSIGCWRPSCLTPGIMDEYGDPTLDRVGWPVRAILFLPRRIRSRAMVFPRLSCRVNCPVKRWRTSSPGCKGCCISIWTGLAANSGILARTGAAPTFARISRTCCSSTVWFQEKNRIAFRPATASPPTSAAELVAWAQSQGLSSGRPGRRDPRPRRRACVEPQQQGPVRTDRVPRQAVRRCRNP